MEAIVSATVVASAFTGTFIALDASTKTADRTAQSTAAYDVASAEIERLRRLGDTNLSSLLAQNGVVSTTSRFNGKQNDVYTMTDTAMYTTGVGATATDACGNSDAVNGAKYVYIKVKVTYGTVTSSTGPIKPVELDTYFATEGGDLQTATGSIRLLLKNAADVPLENRTVQLYRTTNGTNTLVSTGTTNAIYGCVVYTGLPRGDYELRIPTTTETDKYGSTNPVVRKVKVASRAAIALTINISPPVTLRFNQTLSYVTRKTSGGADISITPGTSATTDLVGPITAMSTELTGNIPSGYSFFPYAATRGMYPLATGYSFYPGSCVENNPDDAGIAGAELVVLPSVGNSSWAGNSTYSPDPTMRLPAFRVKVGDAGGTLVGGGKVQVQLVATTCGTAPAAPTAWKRLPGTTSSVSGSVGELADASYALPYGYYNVCVRQDRTVPGTWSYQWVWKGWYWAWENVQGPSTVDDFYGTANNIRNVFPGPNNFTYGTASTTACGDSGLWG